jgi:hypothetical protein
MRAVGSDAESDERTRFGRRDPRGHSSAKASRSAIMRSEGASSTSRSGSVSLAISAAMQAAGAVFRLGLEHDIGGRQPKRLQLLGDEEAVAVIAEHEEVAEQTTLKPAAGLLEQRLLAGQLEELLGKRLTRQGPQPGAGAAA